MVMLETATAMAMETAIAFISDTVRVSGLNNGRAWDMVAMRDPNGNLTAFYDFPVFAKYMKTGTGHRQ